jgi:nucleoside-diphosphate-sugar epimerase
LITGASGFVGRALCAALVKNGYMIRAALRDAAEFSGAECENVRVPTIDPHTDWTEALHGMAVVIHLAARVHVMHDVALNPLEEFRKVNVAGTEQLARSAAASGVRRFVYVSSIKVNGDTTREGRKFVASDLPNPQDYYGISKAEAEQVLHRVSNETGMEIVIIRPPLVYGTGVKGNFAQMMQVLAKDVPLPLASVQNLRSLVYVENLVDALILCATHPAAAGKTYLVSDGEDISTPDLLRMLGNAMGHPARLFSCPPALLKFVGCLMGKSAQIERLLDSLQIDTNKICSELGWRPPFTVQEGLRLTGNASLKNRAGV